MRQWLVPHWGSVGPLVTYPQKVSLIRLTDRPVQLETPRHYFLSAFTPNAAFYVRWHLDMIPNAINLSEWRLFVEGNVEKSLSLSMIDLMSKFQSVSIAAVNQCSGNSRSRFQPRVPVRVLTEPDTNFWMSTAYRIPDNPQGTTTPDDVKACKVKMVPIGLMPVRSFIVTPDGSSKVPVSMPITVRGIALSGYGRVVKVEFSEDDAKTWREAKLGEDYGPYSFRTWEYTWTPQRTGNHLLAVRATDEKGNVQPDEGRWNPGGYLWNKIERQEIVVGDAA
ncbi:MAG: molybdopterin-dependent oxidoreductase [Acidobacteria bacterium]|nr:molybdopterin-dependent oxidoreductase [Acidobacteriota bacterium]